MRALTGLAILTLALGAVALSSAQQPGGGRTGAGTQANPATLVNNPAVRKELNLTDDQVKKLPDAYLKALAEVLDKKQLARLRQITLQQQGAQAFADTQVQKDLKFTGKQTEQVESIVSDYKKELKALNDDKDGGFERFKKMTTLRKETNEKLENVLTSDQKKTWQDMTGEEFKMPTFGGGGFGKKKAKKV